MDYGIRIVVLFGALFFGLRGFTQETGLRFGEGKAVEKVTEDGSFKLSTKAVQVIGLQMRVAGPPPVKIPDRALVRYGDKTGVYRRRDGFFKLLPVKASRSPGGNVSFASGEILPSDEVVIDGLGLLRVSEMDAFGGEG